MREDPVVERLDRILKLLVQVHTAEKSQIERIQLLAAVGLGATEIAQFLGTTANTVHVALHKIRSRPQNRRGKL
jgi:DNA-directed RNA polymerase specialized sigma24 family protein